MARGKSKRVQSPSWLKWGGVSGSVDGVKWDSYGGPASHRRTSHIVQQEKERSSKSEGEREERCEENRKGDISEKK